MTKDELLEKYYKPKLDNVYIEVQKRIGEAMSDGETSVLVTDLLFADSVVERLKKDGFRMLRCCSKNSGKTEVLITWEL